MSSDITEDHVTSCDITEDHVTSCDITEDHVTSCDILQMESCQYNYVQALHCYIMYNLYVFWKVISDGLVPKFFLPHVRKHLGTRLVAVCVRG